MSRLVESLRDSLIEAVGFRESRQVRVLLRASAIVGKVLDSRITAMSSSGGRLSSGGSSSVLRRSRGIQFDDESQLPEARETVERSRERAPASRVAYLDLPYWLLACV